MTILTLVSKDEPILHMKLERFNFETPPTDPIQLAKDLTETMIDRNGLGLAANQCGLPYRVFVIKANPVFACFNPHIVDFGEEISDLEEGCLTYPGLYLKIKRPTNVRVRFTHPNGVTDTHKFAGLTSRIFQHEYDHLEGKRFTDLAGKLQLQIAIKKAAKNGHHYTMKDFI
jgi:peptide deformylase